jgi:type IV secretory pathway TraG/TraD family ATPase VirD4
MKSFNRAVEWCHRQISPDPRQWPSRLPLLRWNGWRPFTVGHSLEHVLELGATGSGKTSSCLKTLSLGMLHAGYGVLFLTAKAEDASDYLQWAKAAGREKSVVHFGPGHRLGFNLLEYELARGENPESRTMNIPGIFAAAGEIMARNKNAGGGDGLVWVKAAEQLLRHAVNVVVLATGKVELDAVVKVVLTAPRTPEQAADPSWQRESACYQRLAEAIKARGHNRALELASQYFLQQWATYPNDTKYSTLFTCNQITDLFQSDPLHRLFFSQTDFTPEILTEGAVLIVDAPALGLGDQGKVINGLMRLAVERMVHGRTVTNRKRPVAIIWDEFQTSVTDADSAFVAVARSPRCAVVQATQNVNAVDGRMGKNEARALFGNCRTKVFFANDDPDTNEYMADVIGKWPTEKKTKTQASKSGSSTAKHQEDEYAVPPREALKLESGGDEYGLRVTGILAHGGRKLTKSQPWLKVRFNQAAPVWHWWNLLTRNTGAIGWRRPAPDFRWLR